MTDLPEDAATDAEVEEWEYTTTPRLIARIRHDAERLADLEREFSANVDHLDLMVDEFGRIRALMMGGHPAIAEVKQLCERAVAQTIQRVPVIKQRDDTIRMLNDATAERDKLRERIAELRAALETLRAALETERKIAAGKIDAVQTMTTARLRRERDEAKEAAESFENEVAAANLAYDDKNAEVAKLREAHAVLERTNVELTLEVARRGKALEKADALADDTEAMAEATGYSAPESVAEYRAAREATR